MKMRLFGVAAIAVMSGCVAQSADQEMLGTAEEAVTIADQEWGGSYQLDDCGRNKVINSVSGYYDCSPGFTKYQINRQLAPESRCGASDYVCMRNKPTGNPLTTSGFYGMYQVDDLGNRLGHVFNPLTNSLRCPAGATAVKIARVLAPESNNGAWQYGCYCNNSFSCPSGAIKFGGTYQVGDFGQNNKPNPFTGAISCPYGYRAYKYGRVMGAEAQTGVTQYYCAP